ncbi:MAG: sigma-54-dependent Fis family transcriptional regulator [Flavobacteriaceae bacterium]|nr:sigma-54-dependent Fis family transcriptional regulator [Flavobacteriaceae bacterium]MBL6684095.1 sigma-54-dependent Fis family transcriptional regulator [Flavobacteriaceae bacterium]
MSKILIVEDENAIRRVLKKVLSEEDSKYKLDEAANGEEAISLIKSQHYDLILCDIKMPKKDGIDVLEFVIGYDSKIPIIMISGHGDLKTAVKAMRLGAFDYIEKPPDLNNLLTSVRSALKNTSFKKLKINPKKTTSKYEIIGDSKEIVNVKKLIEKISPTNAKVLILGPNGSGKELVARQIHSNSLRSDGPFIELNCAAIPSELIESELFGHIKGSFTSAHKDRTGKFEAANNGTIFLDEIGDMSMSAQSKVLRAIQENKIQKVGSEKDIYVDTRVIAATNKNISKLISENKFREDLYHRISVIELNVPPLNDRKDDIPILIEHFISLLSNQYENKRIFIDETGMKKMKSYDWKGNVRELRNVIERLFILSENDQISDKEVAKFSGKK